MPSAETAHPADDRIRRAAGTKTATAPATERSFARHAASVSADLRFARSTTVIRTLAIKRRDASTGKASTDLGGARSGRALSGNALAPPGQGSVRRWRSPSPRSERSGPGRLLPPSPVLKGETRLVLFLRSAGVALLCSRVTPALAADATGRVLALVHLPLLAIARGRPAGDPRNHGSRTDLPAIGGPEIRQLRDPS